MPDDPRMLKILRRLLERTEAREQEWTPSKNSDFRFLTDIADWLVIVESEDEDGSFPFRLSIHDQDNREIDFLRSAPIPQNTPEDERRALRARNIGIRELYEKARRSALKIDFALDSIEDLLA